MNHTRPDLLVKAALVGDYAVGKTSLFQRYIYDKLSYQPTIGVDFMPRTERVGGLDVTLHLWDTAGQERFRSIVRTYFRSVYLFVLVFDVSRLASFAALAHWLKVIAQDTTYGYRVLLVANKADKPETEWQVSRLDVTAFAEQRGIDARDVHFVSAEAADDPTVARMFRTTLATLVEDLDYLEPFGGLVDRRRVVPRVGGGQEENDGLWARSVAQLQRMGFTRSRADGVDRDADGLQTPPPPEEDDDQESKTAGPRRRSRVQWADRAPSSGDNPRGDTDATVVLAATTPAEDADAAGCCG